MTILQLILYKPQLYSGLDHYLVKAAEYAHKQSDKFIAVYLDDVAMSRLLEDWKNAGAIVECIPSDTWQMLRAIKRLYKQYKPDVVDTHFFLSAKLYSCWLSKKHNILHYTHFHSLLGLSPQDYVKKRGKIKAGCLRGCYKYIARNSKIVCISNAVAEQCKAWLPQSLRESVKTYYIGTTFHTPFYIQSSAREKVGVPQDAFVIANVGAIEYIKGIDIILQAVAYLKQEEIDVLFIHIGGLRNGTQQEKEYEMELKQMAINLGVADNVIWLGKRNDILDILPFADVYVHPSRSEGMGSAIMEAGYAGLPLIGTKVGGIPEIIQDGVNGMLVENEDYVGLANAVKRLYQDVELREQYGKMASIIVKDTFNQNVLAQDYCSLVRRLW